MKKRLRKKKRVGEFQVIVFKVGFRFSNDFSVEERDELLDAFLEKAIESNGLQFGGGCDNNTWEGVVEHGGNRFKTTEQHRQLIEKWLVQEKRVLEYQIGPLVDGWYGDFSESVAEHWKKK